MNYLPIGTVVTLINGTKPIMIYGRKQMQQGNEKIWDYVACLYPVGAKGGAAVGAWLFGAAAGIASGGVLTAPAAALGGVIGGFLGGIGGSYVGGWLFEEGVDAIIE